MLSLGSPCAKPGSPSRRAGPARLWKGLTLLPPQAKLPNLKEVDVRYTEAW